MRGESVTIRERTRAIKFGEGVELCELGIILDSWKAKKGTRLMNNDYLEALELLEMAARVLKRGDGNLTTEEYEQWTKILNIAVNRVKLYL